MHYQYSLPCQGLQSSLLVPSSFKSCGCSHLVGPLDAPCISWGDTHNLTFILQGVRLCLHEFIQVPRIRENQLMASDQTALSGHRRSVLPVQWCLEMSKQVFTTACLLTCYNSSYSFHTFSYTDSCFISRCPYAILWLFISRWFMFFPFTWSPGDK